MATTMGYHAENKDIPRKPSPEAPVIGFLSGDVDILIADDEDINRLSGSMAVTRYGCPPSMVYEAEDKDSALATIEQLQQTGYSKEDPSRYRALIVFVGKLGSVSAQCCAQSIRDLCLTRKPFIVGVLSKRGDSNPCFDHIVPKTFEKAKLQACLLECHQWWLSAGAASPTLDIKTSPQPSVGFAATVDTLPPISTEETLPVVTVTQESLPVVEAVPEVPGDAEAEAQEEAERRDELVSNAMKESIATRQEQVVSNGHGNSCNSLGRLLPPLPPFNDVEALQLVSRGSYGSVYRARWGVATVALKVIEHMGGKGQVLDQAFEGALCQHLSHPNLVQTYKSARRDKKHEKKNSYADVVESEVWIVQEWCGLGTLNQNLCRKQETPAADWWLEIPEVSAEIANAIGYLHERGIIHGDLSGGNVLFFERDCTKGYIAKVTDFGLARVLRPASEGIDTISLGTVSYMPPEVFNIEGSLVTKGVDVYSLGTLMWQLCTGLIPYKELHPTQIVVKVVQGMTLELPEGTPGPLGDVVKQCLCRDPALRMSIQNVVKSLKHQLNLEPSIGSRANKRADAQK